MNVGGGRSVVDNRRNEVHSQTATNDTSTRRIAPECITQP